MSDERARRLFTHIPEGMFLIRIKFILIQYIPPEDNDGENEWVVEYKFDPVKTETRRGEQTVEISREIRRDVLAGIDKV